MASDDHKDTKFAHQEDWCYYLSAFKFKILSIPLHGPPVPQASGSCRKKTKGKTESGYQSL